MRTTRRMLLVLVAGLAVLLPATAAGAASTATYHGVFTGVTWAGCTVPQTAQATGTWSFAEHGSTGTLAVNIFLDGKHHVAFGGTLPLVQVPGADWAVRLDTAAGTLTVSLAGDQLSYDIPDYTDPFGGGFTCEDVTYHGVTR